MVATVAAAQAPPALSITSPASGTAVSAGQSLSVTITIGSGTYPNGMAVFAKAPLGVASVQSVTGSTVTLSLAIPANTPPGAYALTAMSMDSTGALVSSVPVSVDVQRADTPTSLLADPAALTLRFVGDTLPLTVWGTFAGVGQLDVTQSSQLTTQSENPNVATAQNGMITARGPGQTSIDVTYGSITVKIAVTVPTSIRGDLNGDGQVDRADLNIIMDVLNTPANGPNDARDLNHDGVINVLDARILVTLCTHAGCTAQ
jgi:hypothetical protein